MGSIPTADLHSIGDLLKAIMAKGEVMIGTSVSETQVVVFYTLRGRAPQRLTIPQTKWKELRGAESLLVYKLVHRPPTKVGTGDG